MRTNISYSANINYLSEIKFEVVTMFNLLFEPGKKRKEHFPSKSSLEKGIATSMFSICATARSYMYNTSIHI